ncbi:uncharacterized protein LOC130449739 isoform X2 [Diorhabda sublineata]|uniref:uncharacterized protein LOC130449739 isoform X2 n=1 Tax=Diorhabda sublineata TaxID=1163346 RepID=UPI0024E054C9|nr:uncharacterized protein LOC130449739 isoform X2 [Diorhabda sublineata]
MAAPEPVKDLQLLKKTKISVFVDEILPDILVVTYEFGVQLFKGVLLDSTKRNLPCGIQTINPAFSVKSKNPDDDPLYTVNQRFAYMDPNAPKKKNVQMGTKFKSNKMTVRLRPRQVLCSKCKGICNENSENISRKRKNEDTLVSSPPKRSLNAPITRSVNHLNNKRSLRGKEPTLVPRLTRLNFVEEETIVKNQQKDTDKAQDRVKPQNTPEPEKPKILNVSPEVTYTEEIPNLKTDKPSTVSILRSKRILRKKRSISTEITTEDTNQQDNTNRNQVPQPMQNSDTQNSYNLSTRTIKISYGPQGEGTVLKIPAQIDSLNDDSEENVNNEEQNNKPKIMDNKAARRALKKAKKEARRKVLLGGSPLYLGGASPRYTIGSASPRQGLGNGSPRYMCSTYDINLPRRRKHKVKHKKKHKEEKDRKHKEGEVSSTQDESKEQYITQKLSINLKRLNNSYTQQASSDNHEDMSSSDEHSETVPDFPSPSNPPVMLRINTHTVPSSLGADDILQ